MKDPAFLFYPGDYLRDTQILSESVQVAYDRIMCEHMRNICISQTQLKFLTKRLNEDEKEELLMVLTKVNGGYQIEWVAESIEKRRKYSESRKKNRIGKSKDNKKICKTYDSHMENENENENIDKEKRRITKEEIFIQFDDPAISEIWNSWRVYKKEQFRFNYKTIGEVAALKKLHRLSSGDISIAGSIVMQSIENSWSGLFELKTNSINGSKSKLTDYTRLQELVKEKYSQ